MLRSRLITSFNNSAAFTNALSTRVPLLARVAASKTNNRSAAVLNRLFFFASMFFAPAAVFFLTSYYSNGFSQKFFSSSSGVAFCSAPLPDVPLVVSTADRHHDADEVAASYNITKRAVDAFPGGAADAPVELLWRYGRALYLTGKNETADTAAKEKFLRESVDVLQKALDKDGDNWAAHKWMGMSLGSLGDFMSTSDSIANAYKIRDHFQRALQGNPRDATTAHCMGTWCWNILNVGGLSRSVASWIFAEPPSTTFEECEGYLLKSHELDQVQPHNSLLLGDLYVFNGDTAAAKKWYAHAAQCPANTDYQREYVKQAEEKLRLLG